MAHTEPTHARAEKPSPPKNVSESAVKDSSAKVTNPPSAPTALKVTAHVIRPTATTIANTLAELADPDFLRLARSYSYRYDLLIYRWSIQLTELLLEFSASEPLKIQVWRIPLDKIEQLTAVNLPRISEAEQLLKDAQVTLPSIGIPLGNAAATYFLEMAWLLTIGYFWIWYREARLSPNFPAPGTVFGAFARSPTSRGIFVCLIMLPPIIAGLVAWHTLWFTYWNSFFAVLVVVVACLIRREGELKLSGPAPADNMR